MGISVPDAAGMTSPIRFLRRAHACGIEPDWLLVYQVDSGAVDRVRPERIRIRRSGQGHAAARSARLPQYILHHLGMLGDNRQQDPRGRVRTGSPLFPVAQRGRRKAELH